MNCSKKDEEAYANLQEALSKMLLVLKHVNDSMHSIGIEGYRVRILRQILKNYIYRIFFLCREV